MRVVTSRCFFCLCIVLRHTQVNSPLSRYRSPEFKGFPRIFHDIGQARSIVYFISRMSINTYTNGDVRQSEPPLLRGMSMFTLSLWFRSIEICLIRERRLMDRRRTDNWTIHCRRRAQSPSIANRAETNRECSWENMGY